MKDAAIVVISKARVTDASEFYETELGYSKTPGLIVSRPEDLKIENYERLIAKLSDESQGLYIKAELDNHYAGHAFLERMGMSALNHIVRLTVIVHPEHRGKGVGRAMLEHLIEWARSEKDIHKIELQVRSGNEPAINLYRAFGFEQEAKFQNRIKLQDGNYLDDIAMGLFL